MPITKGAKKAHRASLKKRVFNVRRRNTMNDVVKKIKKLLLEGKGKEARELMPEAYRAIDKATKRGIIKENTASRKKSRLSATIKRTG